MSEEEYSGIKYYYHEEQETAEGYQSPPRYQYGELDPVMLNFVVESQNLLLTSAMLY